MTWVIDRICKYSSLRKCNPRTAPPTRPSLSPWLFMWLFNSPSKFANPGAARQVMILGDFPMALRTLCCPLSPASPLVATGASASFQPTGDLNFETTVMWTASRDGHLHRRPDHPACTDVERCFSMLADERSRNSSPGGPNEKVGPP